VEATEAPRVLWRRVGHLVEAPLAYPELTVRENLTAAALLHGMDPAAAAPAVTSWVDRLALEPWLDRRASHLSSGNRQRLGLAAALVHGPEVLVLDEPANALDPAGVVLVREVLRELRSDGVAVLVSSHHLDQLARIADHITVLHRGRRVGSLEPDGVDLERTFFELVHDADRAATEAA
jgi:ABC-2 type transport system ATP-binding protein